MTTISRPTVYPEVNMNRQQRFLIPFILILGLALAGLSWYGYAHASTAPRPAMQEVSPMHPTFALLDENGENVLKSGKAVSTMKTCGQCHDTQFIVSHSYHSDLGFSEYVSSKESWNASKGLYGGWNPLVYRYLSQEGDERLDLGTPEWLMAFGERIVGGAPTTLSRKGVPLTQLAPRQSVEASILRNGHVEGWDWQASGTMEMNCFLCHLEKPNNAARIQAIRNGSFGWANTATLEGYLVRPNPNDGAYEWIAEAFAEDGTLKPEYVRIQPPTNENCGQCHGTVHSDIQVPLVLEACTWETGTTGQIISPQRISQSGMNIAAKATLERSWDIHAERQLKCTDCHFSLNNPIYANQKQEPSHLLFDPRRLELGEYLKRPDHNFARGQSAQYNVAAELKGTMRRCESCHNAQKSHANWLPYIERHMAVLACESCHIPQMYAPAIEYYDWTVLKPNAQPQTACRGIEQGVSAEVASLSKMPFTVSHLVTGYKPVLLQRTNIDGQRLLAPYNLITTFYWVYDDANGNTRPVRLVDLQVAYFKGGQDGSVSYRPEIVAAFDTNGDGTLSENELVIDSAAKQEAVAKQLASLGLKNPRIQGQVQPYSINHNIADGDHAVRDCRACHGENSRLTQPLKLADYTPAGVMPTLVEQTNVNPVGEIVRDENGALYYVPQPVREGIYIFGHSRVKWVDSFGALFFVGVLLGVLGHGTLRYISFLRQPRKPLVTRRVYMYQAYERFWHWLQVVVIVLLLFTGLIIHRPDLFGAFSFRYTVTVHNILAAILVINAALALFYHLTTGEIRQFIPRPYGFFDDAIVQAKYYIQGIFKGEPHPFEKRPEKKMNPLQQATYFGLLNVLLPLQVLTGALMWGAQKWPQIANAVGGLPFLAPFHTLIAWLFAAFIVGHVYLTTTGATPLEAIRGMITGWEEVEAHESSEAH